MKKLTALLLSLLMFVPIMSLGAVAEDGIKTPFTDITEGAWYYDYVSYCYSEGLLAGTGETTFGLGVTVTRGQFVQALFAMEGLDKADYDRNSSFPDVIRRQWYAPAVEWAKENNVVSGYGNGEFGPNDSITREQMALMFCNYAKYLGHVAEDERFDAALDFTDAADISSWAMDGVLYAVAKELMVGSNGRYDPLGEAKREQLAVVMEKFDKLYPAEEEGYPQPQHSRIVAWGDSLTQGIIDGFHDITDRPYHAQAAILLGIESDNFGIGGETAEAIAMRQGGIAIYLENVTIPADTTTIPVVITAEDGYDTKTLADAGDAGLNPVDINGIKGNITWNSEYTRHEFTRLEAGDEMVITDPVRIVTAGMGYDYSDSIMVICSGANNTKDQAWHDDPVTAIERLCTIQQKMVDYAGVDEYIIIGLPKVRFMQKIPQYNYILEEYWGEHYLDVNEYMMSEECFAEHGITLSGPDKKDIFQDFLPRCLLDKLQNLHPNQQGYDIIGALLADKITELGY